jgi:phosphoribosylaminoimidazolecarboxamide formyltransferase/IMP cyclohydrolase
MAQDRLKIVRALLGVSDKTGLADFARALSSYGVELISTGGTQAALEAAGLQVKTVEKFTGFPELLDGRVKTLHPKIHGGILARRSLSSHQEQMRAHGLEPIDLVVVNFYPFERVVAEPSVSLETAIENIDIGGPTLARAAAKNYADVAVVVDPADYADLIEELRRGDGCLSERSRWRLACKAFERVAAYDCAITQYLRDAEKLGATDEAAELGSTFSISLARAHALRYGENPHQKAALYGEFLKIAQPLHGKELSFNNVVDINCAIGLILDLADYQQAVVAIFKHNTPCGVGVADTPRQAWDKAFASDPDSPFGGVIVSNRPFDVELAHAVDQLFTEVLIAPGYDAEALALLRRKRDRRLIHFNSRAVARGELDVKKVFGGLLVQTADVGHDDPNSWRVVTRRGPSAEEMEALKFAWRVCKHVKSNAVVFAKADRTLAIGGGATARIDAVHVARDKAARLNIPLAGSVMASEAFFPFSDGPKLAAEAGATAIAQPGGSVRDAEAIAAADEHGLAMVFTGVRHFRH